MQCPHCESLDNKVVDSRLSQEGAVIRRRRECLKCERRFTTYERVEEMSPMVIKKDGRREHLDRQKILAGLKKACEKRPISVDTLDAVATRIEKKLQENGETEISSRAIGEAVMAELYRLDQVAYVRFASVYREFKDLNQFMSELKGLLDRDPSNADDRAARPLTVKEGGSSTKASA
ncbi:MAG: transcriptional repressor NrdR [Nitrospirae bacterium]|nr:transcriptional repressor NrdR [Nitrospirota bacterium]